MEDKKRKKDDKRKRETSQKVSMFTVTLAPFVFLQSRAQKLCDPCCKCLVGIWVYVELTSTLAIKTRPKLYATHQSVVGGHFVSVD